MIDPLIRANKYLNHQCYIFDMYCNFATIKDNKLFSFFDLRFRSPAWLSLGCHLVYIIHITYHLRRMVTGEQAMIITTTVI